VREGRIYPVDANGCFSRPGPRLVDGIERLAAILLQTTNLPSASV
jgi:iron complex transport system substrate-binding protein